MLICLGIEEDNLDSLLAVQFEKANYFIFLESNHWNFDIIDNLRGFFRKNISHQIVASKNPDLLITGNIEPASYDFLKASGIKIASGIFGISAREAINRYLYGRLREGEHMQNGKGKIL